MYIYVTRINNMDKTAEDFQTISNQVLVQHHVNFPNKISLVYKQQHLKTENKNISSYPQSRKTIASSMSIHELSSKQASDPS